MIHILSEYHAKRKQQKFYSADRIAFLDGKGLKNPVIAISVENEADFSELKSKNDHMKQ